jgi:hypothetical protein
MRWRTSPGQRKLSPSLLACDRAYNTVDLTGFYGIRRLRAWSVSLSATRPSATTMLNEYPFFYEGPAHGILERYLL